MGNCFSSPSQSHHHPSGPGPSPGIARLPEAPVGGVMVPGLQTDPGLTFAGLNNHGRPSLDHGTGPRPLPDPSENTPSNVKVGQIYLLPVLIIENYTCVWSTWLSCFILEGFCCSVWLWRQNRWRPKFQERRTFGDNQWHPGWLVVCKV